MGATTTWKYSGYCTISSSWWRTRWPVWSFCVLKNISCVIFVARTRIIYYLNLLWKCDNVCQVQLTISWNVLKIDLLWMLIWLKTRVKTCERQFSLTSLFCWPNRSSVINGLIQSRSLGCPINSKSLTQLHIQSAVLHSTSSLTVTVIFDSIQFRCLGAIVTLLLAWFCLNQIKS